MSDAAICAKALLDIVAVGDKIAKEGYEAFLRGEPPRQLSQATLEKAFEEVLVLALRANVSALRSMEKSDE